MEAEARSIGVDGHAESALSSGSVIYVQEYQACTKKRVAAESVSYKRACWLT